MNLDRKFKHRSFFKGSDLTVREFLELAAESDSFWVEIKTDFNSDYLLDDSGNTYSVLKCEDSKCAIRLSSEEADYFNERRRFWRRWQDDFSKNNFKGVCDNTYIEMGKTKKREVPEYLQAILKLEGSLIRR